MPVNASVTEGQNELVIQVNGNFDFNLHKDFREAYSGLKAPIKSCVIDMANTEYMDSSALGMLLILKDHAASVGADVKLRNCKPDIQSILAVANFDDMFEME